MINASNFDLKSIKEFKENLIAPNNIEDTVKNYLILKDCNYSITSSNMMFPNSKNEIINYSDIKKRDLEIKDLKKHKNFKYTPEEFIKKFLNGFNHEISNYFKSHSTSYISPQINDDDEDFFLLNSDRKDNINNNSSAFKFIEQTEITKVNENSNNISKSNTISIFNEYDQYEFLIKNNINNSFTEKDAMCKDKNKPYSEINKQPEECKTNLLDGEIEINQDFELFKPFKGFKN